MNAANIVNKIQTARKLVHILMMFIINERKENVNERCSILQPSYESSRFFDCLYILKGITNMVESGNKFHARKNRPVFFCFVKKWLSSLTQNVQGQRFFRWYDRGVGSSFRTVFPTRKRQRIGSDLISYLLKKWQICPNDGYGMQPHITFHFQQLDYFSKIYAWNGLWNRRHL